MKDVDLTPYPKAYREFGFELWALIYDRNSSKVADRLNNPLEEDPIYEIRDPREVSARTVRKWSETEKWADRAENLFRTIAPGVHHQAASTILVSSIEAANYLREVINDNEADPKYRVDAAKTMLDRAGHMPWVRPKDDSKPIGPSRDYEAAIAGKSDEELMNLILGLPSGNPATVEDE